MKKTIILYCILILTGCTTTSNTTSVCEITQNDVLTKLTISEDDNTLQFIIPNSYLNNIDLTEVNTSKIKTIFRNFIEGQGYVITDENTITFQQDENEIIIETNQSKDQLVNSLVQKYDYDKESNIITLLKNEGFECN